MEGIIIFDQVPVYFTIKCSELFPLRDRCVAGVEASWWQSPRAHPEEVQECAINDAAVTDEYDRLVRVFMDNAVKSGTYTKRKLCPVLASGSHGAIGVMLVVWLAKSCSKFFQRHALSFAGPEFLNVVVQQYWEVKCRGDN